MNNKEIKKLFEGNLQKVKSYAASQGAICKNCHLFEWFDHIEHKGRGLCHCDTMQDYKHETDFCSEFKPARITKDAWERWDSASGKVFFQKIFFIKGNFEKFQLECNPLAKIHRIVCLSETGSLAKRSHHFHSDYEISDYLLKIAEQLIKEKFK